MSVPSLQNKGHQAPSCPDPEDQIKLKKKIKKIIYILRSLEAISHLH